MNDRVKIAGAVVGGYVLGRTKKGRLAIKMALWLAGNDYRPANLLRNGVGRLATDGRGVHAQGCEED